ncbi:MAG: glycosyltransferase [Clostridiales bacterium]|nr:glycosyltransferase [Clostridiales bacterium]
MFREKKGRWDILWCNKCDLSNIAYLKAAKVGGFDRIIIHSHNSYNMYTGLKFYIKQIIHYINKFSVEKYVTDFWACSDYAAEWLFPVKVMNEDKVCYIPNAVDTDIYRFDKELRSRKCKQLSVKNNFVIGYIGRLTTQKNPKYALEIFNEIYKKNNNALFMIAGTGDLESSIRSEVESLECNNAVRFLGSRNDVPELMQAMDVLLLPSLYEGLPVVAVEAQAAGLPIFAASDGITSQVKITDYLHFLKLSDGYEAWANEIMSSDLTRRDCSEEIKKSGFDIREASKKLDGMFKMQRISGD